MKIDVTKPLFAWDCLDDSPTLSTVKELLAAIPDGPLLAALRRERGKGRGDYPVHVLWGVQVLAVALRHPTTEACLAELRRNAGLRRLIGIEWEEQVPNKWNMSRFAEVLGREPHRTHVKQLFNTMIQRLGEVVPDLGRDTAGDATSLSARCKADDAAQEEVEEGLPQPSGGRKEYTDDSGKVTEVLEWFGYKLHLLVDVKHEVSLSYDPHRYEGGRRGNAAHDLCPSESKSARRPHRDPPLRQGGRHQRRACLAVRGRHQGSDSNPQALEGGTRADAAGTRRQLQHRL